jgi:hypothetical protein
MAHLSDWHAFDPNDESTHPNVVAPIQVRFEDGTLEEGVSLPFFPHPGGLEGLNRDTGPLMIDGAVMAA